LAHSRLKGIREIKEKRGYVTQNIVPKKRVTNKKKDALGHGMVGNGPVDSWCSGR